MAQRILLADDSAAVLELVRTFLEAEGFAVVGSAANGVEAADLARTVLPDIAVLDVAMPLMNGIEAAERIHLECPGVHVILLTAYSTEQLIVKAFRAGIRGYVVKGDAPDDLVRAIWEVSRGNMFLSPSVSRFVVEAYLPETDRRYRS